MSKVNASKKLCSQPHVALPVLSAFVSLKRASFIFRNSKKWVNGTEIKYMFIEGPEKQWDVVSQAFRQWKDLVIALSFKEVAKVDESMVRIGFDLSDGSWSYVGRDVLTIEKPGRTMNFGWDLTADTYGLTTALLRNRSYHWLSA